MVEVHTGKDRAADTDGCEGAHVGSLLCDAHARAVREPAGVGNHEIAGRHAVDNLHAVLQASSRPHALFAHNAILDQQQLFHSGEDHQGALWDDDAQALVGDDLCAREHARALAAVFVGHFSFDGQRAVAFRDGGTEPRDAALILRLVALDRDVYELSRLNVR